MHLGKKDTPSGVLASAKVLDWSVSKQRRGEMTSCHMSTLYAGSNGK